MGVVVRPNSVTYDREHVAESAGGNP